MKWPISAADLWYLVSNAFPSCLLPQLRLLLPRWVTFSGWQKPSCAGWRETPGRTRVYSACVMGGNVSSTLGSSKTPSTHPALRYSRGACPNLLESIFTSFLISSSHQGLWLNQKVFRLNPVRKTLLQIPSKVCCLTEAGKNVLLSPAAGGVGGVGGMSSADHLLGEVPCISDNDLFKLVSISPLFKTLQEIRQCLHYSTNSGSSQHLHNGAETRTPQVKYDWSLKYIFCPCRSWAARAGEQRWLTYPDSTGQALTSALCRLLVWLPGDAVACNLSPVPLRASAAGRVPSHFIKPLRRGSAGLLFRRFSFWCHQSNPLSVRGTAWPRGTFPCNYPAIHGLHNIR